jgi:hypothetical protein
MNISFNTRTFMEDVKIVKYSCPKQIFADSLMQEKGSLGQSNGPLILIHFLSFRPHN